MAQSRLAGMIRGRVPVRKQDMPAVDRHARPDRRKRGCDGCYVQSTYRYGCTAHTEPDGGTRRGVSRVACLAGWRSAVMVRIQEYAGEIQCVQSDLKACIGLWRCAWRVMFPFPGPGQSPAVPGRAVSYRPINAPSPPCFSRGFEDRWPGDLQFHRRIFGLMVVEVIIGPFLGFFGRLRRHVCACTMDPWIAPWFGPRGDLGSLALICDQEEFADLFTDLILFLAC
jgi:hypothetical protein